MEKFVIGFTFVMVILSMVVMYKVLGELEEMDERLTDLEFGRRLEKAAMAKEMADELNQD